MAIFAGKKNDTMATKDSDGMEIVRAFGGLAAEMTEEGLWETMVACQGIPLRTVSGLDFAYRLKRGQEGQLNKELIIDRRESGKTVVWSSVVLAFRAAMGRRGEVIKGPKELGWMHGVSYIYPMLWRFGVIEVPEEIAEKMGGM